MVGEVVEDMGRGCNRIRREIELERWFVRWGDERVWGRFVGVDVDVFWGVFVWVGWEGISDG